MTFLETRLARVAMARVQLHEDWRRILRRAWSVRFMIAAAVLSGAEGVWGIFATNPPIAPLWSAVINFILISSAFVARMIAQSSFKVTE